MSNLVLSIHAPDRATFWLAAEYVGLGVVKVNDAGVPYLATTRFVEIHDNNGLGLPIVVVPATYDSSGAELSPSVLAPEYHANIVINGQAVGDDANNIPVKLALWREYGAATVERGEAYGRESQSVVVLQGVRTPQHNVSG